MVAAARSAKSWFERRSLRIASISAAHAPQPSPQPHQDDGSRCGHFGVAEEWAAGASGYRTFREPHSDPADPVRIRALVRAERPGREEHEGLTPGNHPVTVRREPMHPTNGVPAAPHSRSQYDWVGNIASE